MKPLPWTESSIAPSGALEQQRIRVTHPFHPLAGQEFDLISRKRNWGEDRVFIVGQGGLTTSIPATWTDVDPPDPYVVVSAGRTAFRIQDLLALAGLLDSLQSRLPKEV